MGDRLSQLQEALDQLTNQFIATYHYLTNHHSVESFGPHDDVKESKNDAPESIIDPLPADTFEAGKLELARDIIVKEQQIEYLISSLPGLDNNEKDQEQFIKDLEEELRVAEAQRLDAVKEKDEVLSKLDKVLRGIRRP